MSVPPRSKLGDIWLLGNHRLMCGNARSPGDLDRLMAGAVADMLVSDPPYNLQISSVVGRGSIKHPEFAEASGEQSSEQFTAFLNQTLGNATRVSRPGGLHYVFMDWRHIGELLAAAHDIYAEHVSTAIWVKSNAGQGSFYRSQHEQILIFRVGGGSHRNNIQLGRYGRNRSNVWSYAGEQLPRLGRLSQLSLHPTVKPLALVADAIKDVTSRGGIVLDIFAGSGTAIVAAEKVGRRAYALELSPHYVDVAIRRWQDFTRRDAVHEITDQTFDETFPQNVVEVEPQSAESAVLGVRRTARQFCRTLTITRSATNVPRKISNSFPAPRAIRKDARADEKRADHLHQNRHATHDDHRGRTVEDSAPSRRVDAYPVDASAQRQSQSMDCYPSLPAGRGDVAGRTRSW